MNTAITASNNRSAESTDVASKDSQPEIRKENPNWLDCYHDPVTTLYTFSQCMTFADIQSDGDSKLLIADLGNGTYDMKLKVYKGTSLMSENTLIDIPTGIVAFYMDTALPRMPAVAVASGPHVYVYKNLRPYFKFTLPQLDVSQPEADVWNQAKEDKIDLIVMRQMLEEMRANGTPLSVRSLKFLTLDQKDSEAFTNLYKFTPLRRQTVITSLATMKKSMTDDDAISCLVVGTESQAVHILDPAAFTILATVLLPSIPVFLRVNGLFDVEYRIIASCRNGTIYMIKRGIDLVDNGIELNSLPVGLERVGKNIVVACMNDTLRSYSLKGKKVWTVNLPAPVTAMTLMDHQQKAFKAVLVALEDRTILVYRDKFLADVIQTPGVVAALLYGRFGREDDTLVMTVKGGGIAVKMLKRNCKLEERNLTPGPPPAQSVKLDVPKKTKLFVDQTVREREHSVVMHRQFQHDLYRLRLNAARSYLHVLDDSASPVSTDPAEPLKVTAQITGIGPTFKLSVSLQNTSLSSAITDLAIAFAYNSRIYGIDKLSIEVPMLVPGLNYAFETLVRCLSDKGVADVIKVFVLKKGKTAPTVTAVINMPVSEAAIVV